MAKPIIAQTAQESTEKEKAASCSGCSRRFPMRLLREEHVTFGYGVRIGERYCRSCARATGVI